MKGGGKTPPPCFKTSTMKVKVINLDKRTGRLETVTDEIHRFGIESFERFSAIEGGYMGFNKSMHYALENESEILLLEDDCVFSGSITDLIAAKSQLPNDWDLLYLGANVKSQQKRYSENLFHLTDAWTSHAILYSDKGARWCFEHFPFEDTMIYDEWLRTVAQQQLRCFIVKPMLAIQADGWSDIWGANTTYGIKNSEIYLK